MRWFIIKNQDLIPLSNVNSSAFDSHVCFTAAYPVVVGQDDYNNNINNNNDNNDDSSSNDESIRLYYFGGNGPHSGERNSSFGLAFLRMDGFVALKNKKENESCSVQTFENSINLTQKYLTVTVDMLSDTYTSFVKVGIVFSDSDDNNRYYNINQSIPISKNVTDYVVQCNHDKSDLTQFIGQLVTLNYNKLVAINNNYYLYFLIERIFIESVSITKT